VAKVTRAAALASYNAVLTAITQSNYTAESWTKYQTVVSAVVVTGANTRAEIEAATAAITVAQGILVTLVDANLTAAKVAAAALTPANFVDFSAVTTALAMAEETNNKKIAKTVVINHAIGALVLIVDANLTAEKVAAGALTPANFVDYSAVTAALAMAEGTDTGKIAKTAAINHAIGALVLIVDANLAAAKVAAGALTPADFVDYSAVTTALAMAEGTDTEKIAKTVAINHAIGALVLIVDANLAAAKVAAGALTPGNFVDYSAVTTALAMAEGTNTEKIAKTVAINHALGALVTLVDANLTAAKVAAGALTPADYVNYSAVTTALAMAEGTDAQKIAKTVAINHAIGALVTFLEAVNTASAETMGSVITSAGLSLTTTTLADYKLLTPASQAVVHAALAGKAFTNNAAVNLAFETAVSVLIINEIPLTSPVAAGNAQMESALARYKTILGLEAIPYATYITPVAVNPNTLSFQSHVNTVLMATTLTSTADVQAAFTAAVTAEAVHTIDIQVLNFMDRELRTFTVILGLDLTDYDALLNKVPVQTQMVAQPFTTVAQIKTSFDSLVAQQKSLENLPLLDAFNSAPDAATMGNVITFHQSLFKAADYNTFTNFIGNPAKTIIETSMLAPTFASEEEIQMAFVIGLMNNQYTTYGQQVFKNNAELLGLATSVVDNEFLSLVYAEQSPITNAVFLAKPIVDRTQIVVVALNSTITESYIGTLLTLNSGLLGLDLTGYNSLTPADKTIVHNALIAANLTNAADVQTTINAAVSTTLLTPAIGGATAIGFTTEITYTLTTGTFDPTAGSLASNWIIGGIYGLMDLESISTVVLSDGNKTATLTVTGTVYSGGDFYTIAPAQAAFAAGFIAPVEVPVIVSG